MIFLGIVGVQDDTLLEPDEALTAVEPGSKSLLPLPPTKSKKSVRFLNATPQERKRWEEEEGESPCSEAAEDHVQSGINVNIPTKSGNISFNEAGAKRGWMQTPGKVRQTQEFASKFQISFHSPLQENDRWRHQQVPWPL